MQGFTTQQTLVFLLLSWNVLYFEQTNSYYC